MLLSRGMYHQEHHYSLLLIQPKLCKYIQTTSFPPFITQHVQKNADKSNGPEFKRAPLQDFKDFCNYYATIKAIMMLLHQYFCLSAIPKTIFLCNKVLNYNYFYLSVLFI